MRPTLILTFLIGLFFFVLSLTMPFYKDGKSQEELWNLNANAFYKKDAELRTLKIPLMDAGSGTMIASAFILLFLTITKTRTIQDLKKIKTLKKWPLLLSANIVWLMMIPGTYWYYSFRLIRGDYPPFADSIGIPLFTTIPFLLFMMIPHNLFLFLTLVPSVLPTSLFLVPLRYDFKLIVIEILFGLLVCLNTFLFVDFLIDGDHFAIVVNLFYSLVLLTIRAGLITSGQESKTPDYNSN